MMESRKVSGSSLPATFSSKEIFMSKSGYEFNYYDERWVISTSDGVNFNWTTSVFETNLQESYKKVLLFFVQNNAPGYARNINYHTKLFFEFCLETDEDNLSFITSRHVINYYSSLIPKKKYLISQVLAFLKKWYELGYEGVDKDVLEIIKELRVKNAEKGKAVRLLCPYEGPLSDLEYEGLYTGLSKEFELGNISLTEMVIVKLFLATGRRPIQIASLKIKDFLGVTILDGNTFDLLRIPKVKQRDTWRTDFTDYAFVTLP